MREAYRVCLEFVEASVGLLDFVRSALEAKIDVVDLSSDALDLLLWSDCIIVSAVLLLLELGLIEAVATFDFNRWIMLLDELLEHGEILRHRNIKLFQDLLFYLCQFSLERSNVVVLLFNLENDIV